MSAKLERATFETSRELDHFSEKELCAQIGHDQSVWPVPILRELIDNALDAAELAGVPPVIEITTTDDRITVTDNGPSIPETTIKRSLEYMVRVSTRSHTRTRKSSHYSIPSIQTGG